MDSSSRSISLFILLMLGISLFVTPTPAVAATQPEAPELVCSISTTDLDRSAPGLALVQQENPCSAIYAKLVDVSGILSDIATKRSEIYQKISERQSGLSEQCPKDLSIIACTSAALQSAQEEYADELVPLNEQYEIQLEYYQRLTKMHSACVEATNAGNPYTVDIPPAPPYDAGGSPVMTPGEDVPTQGGADPNAEETPISDGGIDSDAGPTAPVDNQNPPGGSNGDGGAVDSDGDPAQADGSEDSDTAGESEQRNSRFPLADRAIGRMSQAGPVLEFFGGAITGAVMIPVEFVQGTITTLGEVTSGEALKNFSENVARAWDAGDTIPKKMLNVAGHLTTYINPFPAIMEGLDEMGEGIAEGDGVKFGHGYGTAMGTAVTAGASVAGAAHVTRQTINSRSMPKPKPKDAASKSTYERVGDELDAANKMAIEAREQNEEYKKRGARVSRITTDDGTVYEYPSADGPSTESPPTDLRTDSPDEGEDR